MHVDYYIKFDEAFTIADVMVEEIKRKFTYTRGLIVDFILLHVLVILIDLINFSKLFH